jgi:uncharacterized LabA/DUF88 family protein
LYSEKVDAFSIVSSDSDFTRLAIRLREAGMKVIGLGERKTPHPFIAACDKFIYLEILSPSITEEAAVNVKAEHDRPERKVKTEAVAIQKVGKETINLLANSITDLADDSGWAFLGDVGNLVIKKQTDFDPRNFGYSKLAAMLKSINKFEVDERETDKKGIKLVYVRVKSKSR